MAYRFNFTGRKRVLEADAKIHVVKDANPLKVVLEQTFSLRNLYDANDIVLLEAIRRTKLRRYNLGTVGELQQNVIAEFPGFSDGEEVHYRLRIVDPTTHKLNGLAKKLHDADKTQKPTDLESLLPVAFSQPSDGLGNRFWMVNYDNSGPVLIISSKKFGSHEPVRSPEFKALVLPEVLREVLTYAFIHSALEGYPEWAENWKTFVAVNLGVGGCPEEPRTLDDGYIRDVSQWIDDAVRAFADYTNISAISIKNLTVTEDGNE